MKNLSITEAFSVHLHLANKQKNSQLDLLEERLLREAWNVVESFGAMLVQERRIAEKQSDPLHASLQQREHSGTNR